MSADAAASHVALLRGINVGGKNRLPMADLRRLFEDAGGRSVRTYIQSGNVAFGADDGAAVAAAVSASIDERFGAAIPVVVRTVDELAAAIRDNPYLPVDGAPTVDEKTLHIAFLDRRPSAEQIATLDPRRSPPDRFTVRGASIYLHCPNGLARSQLTNAYFDRRLGVTSTLRNWRTTRKLLELARDG